jgi:iduronate 2-sulfatase
MAALGETGLAKNTIVVFWSDHGYYMGEHTWWGAKHNNYEGATRNCLIVAAPDQKTAGQPADALAQAVDLAPTLAELCDLPENAGFQGRSLKGVLDDPQATVNEAAFSWCPKSGYLGVAMRTDKWRFVEWTKRGEQPVWELYDSVRDPQNDVNLAQRPENRELPAALSAQLRARFPVQDFRQPPAAPGNKSSKKQPRPR